MPSALPRLLDSALRRVRRQHPHASVSYAQEGEDLVLARLLEGRTHGFYVDVGAHHPTRFSNTFFFYERGWRGINIEPAPEAFAEFERRRVRDINVNCGVAEKPGSLNYYVFDDTALNTFDSALMRDREANTPYRVVHATTVRVDRLDALLKAHLPPGQAIDFISIDAEGFDLQVLRSNDWSRWRPRFVLVEALEFDLAVASDHPLHAFMRGERYALVAKTLNTLFYQDRA